MRPTWPARRASGAPGLRARGSRCRLATSAGVNTSIVSQLCGNRELASACRHSHQTSLRTMLVRQPRSPDCPAPRPSARWRSGWPCRWAEANSRLPQRPFAAAVLTPATVTRLHLELRARKPAGMDAHCARQQSSNSTATHSKNQAATGNRPQKSSGRLKRHPPAHKGVTHNARQLIAGERRVFALTAQVPGVDRPGGC